MMRQTITISSKGNTDIIDITSNIQDILTKSKSNSGIAHIFVIGSTAALSTIEFEPGLQKDLKIAYDKIAPYKEHYHHHDKWHDDNGSSHVKATMLKPDLTIPFQENKLILGTWQQVILVDFDTSPRNREIVVTIIKDN